MRRWWSFFMVGAMFVLLTVGNVIYTNHLQAESEHRWCALLVSLDQPDQPATTERGRAVQVEIHGLRGDFRCP